MRCIYEKINFFLTLCLMFSFSTSICAYADDTTVTTTSITTSEVSSETTNITTNEKIVLGYSDIVVKNDDMFSSLEVLLDTYTTDVYVQSIGAETKSFLFKTLTSLVVSVVSGDASYTLETFKDTFVQILANYGINVTNDVIDAITKYAITYLNDELVVDENEITLSCIYSALMFVSVLLVLIYLDNLFR